MNLFYYYWNKITTWFDFSFFPLLPPIVNDEEKMKREREYMHKFEGDPLLML